MQVSFGGLDQFNCCQGRKQTQGKIQQKRSMKHGNTAFNARLRQLRKGSKFGLEEEYSYCFRTGGPVQL
jgi:hypothetical protein